MNKHRFLGAIALLALSSAACREASETRASTGNANGKLHVVCTIGMITDVVKNIGGDHVQVTGLMGEFVDPHLYKATPTDMRLLRGADLVLYNGLHLEGRMGDVFVQMAREKPVIAVTSGIDESRLREPPEFEGQYDPHVWFDVALWMKVSERIRDGLSDLKPAAKDTFKTNTESYLARLRELDQYCKTQIASIPRERRILVTAHDAFGYFGRAYEIEVMAIQGISTDSEANIGKVNELVNTLTTRKIPAVFMESSINEKTIRSLVQGAEGRGHKLTIGGTIFSDAMGKDGTPEGTYIGMVRHNVDTIVKALK